MIDILKAIGVSASVLLPVVVLTLIISIVTVNRGVAAMHGDHGHGLEPALAGAAAAGGTVPAKKGAVGRAADPTVGEILLFGVILFGLAVALLFGISLIGHLS